MKRQVLVFRHFGNKGYSLFACLGREVVCSVLSVATLTYASAESVATNPVVTDSATMTTAREMMLEEVSVTGSRAPLTKSQAARMVTVLDRRDIAQAPVQSVNDLLKYAVGVDVRQRGPIGAQTDISIRGGTSEQIILLLNGINICDPQTGHNAMDLPVDLSEIVRIEVLEGPAGRIYGSSSLVGAINIVTKPASKTSTTLNLEGGSYGYAKASGRANLKQGAWNNQLSAGYSRSDGYSRSKSGDLNADFSGAKAFYQGQYEDHQVRINWHLGIADKGWGSSTSYASPKWQADNQYEHTTKLYSAIQAETHFGKLRLMPSIYWNQNKDRYEGYRGQPDLMKYNYNRTDVYGVNLSSYFDWFSAESSPDHGGRIQMRTAFGAELRNEDLVSGNLGEPLAQKHHISGTDREYELGVNRTNISAYLEHNVLLRKFTLSAGFVAVKHASYNTSLRMPSFTEMYYKLQGYQADPHLKPEEMSALEAGVTFQYSPFTFNATIWHHNGRNMIDWIMDTSKGSEAVWQSVNHTKINSTGIETGIDFTIKALQARIGYGYIHQDKELEEHIVSQYALEYLRHKLTARVDLPLVKRLTLGLNFRWQDRVGQYTDFDGATHDYEPYALLDARLTWQQSQWKVYAEANNLTDKRYRDYGLVEQPGRWLIFGASITL